MSEYHDHRDDCPFKFATLDVCDCVEKNMLDRIEALTKERDEAVHLSRMRKTFIEEARDERDEAQAKLAKALEALRFFRATLAEIKGESQDGMV